MNPKKSAKPEPDVLVYDPSTSKGELRLIGESMSDDWNLILANQAISTLWLKNSDSQRIKRQQSATIDAMAGIKPQDELEGCLLLSLSLATTPRWNATAAL